jgi:hypothetical protein
MSDTKLFTAPLAQLIDHGAQTDQTLADVGGDAAWITSAVDLGLIEHRQGFWEITDAGRAAFTVNPLPEPDGTVGEQQPPQPSAEITEQSMEDQTQPQGQEPQTDPAPQGLTQVASFDAASGDPEQAQVPAEATVASQHGTVEPSESAGTGEAAGSPSEQGAAQEAPQDAESGPETDVPAEGQEDGQAQASPPQAPAPAVTRADLDRQMVPAWSPESDSDVALGTFCTVIWGEHIGRYGVFQTIGEIRPDGRPVTAIVKTRDAEDEAITVNYSDIRPDVAGKR